MNRLAAVIPQQAADVNWLLSAITQSAAALIAIVGGLLVSRYVSLHAEQQGARRRADDLMRRESEANEQLRDRQREFDLYYVDDFLDDDKVFEAVWCEKGQVGVEQLLSEMEADGRNLNGDIGRPWLEGFANELGRRLIAEGYDIISGSGRGSARTC